MSSSENTKARVAAVLVPLFLGFVMPGLLQANREARNLTQYQFELNRMFASAVLEVVLVMVFVVVFVLSLLYFAKQDNARKLLIAASIISLLSFVVFALGQSFAFFPELGNLLYYALMQALMQMFPGLTLIVGYTAGAIAVPLTNLSNKN